MRLKLCTDQGSAKRGRRWRPFFVACSSFCVLLSQSAAAQDDEVSFRFSSRTVSEPISVHGLLHDWRGRLYPGDRAWTRNRLELTYREAAWTLAYVQRYDYLLRFNDTTAELHYRQENGLPAPAAAVPVKLDAWHLRSDGIKLAHRWRWGETVYIEPALTLLRAVDFQGGLIEGELGAEGDMLAGSADLNYRYSEDRLLEHRFDHPSGRGATLDLSIGWQSEKHAVTVQLQDLYGLVDWDSAPYTRGRFDTEDRGGSGAVSLEPAFSGFRGESDYRQKIPAFGIASYTAHRNGFSWQLDAEYFAGELRLRPGVRWGDLPANPYLGYEGRDGQWLLELASDSRSWSLRLGSDSADLEKARSLTVAAGFRLSL